MAIITISRQTFIGGQELGTQLARRLGYNYVTREDLADEAAAMGVNVERLRDAITKPPGVRQELVRERDRYVACVAMLLSERLLKDNVVYNGHAGHMLLLGIPNILRLSVVADLEYRINHVCEHLGYSRREAKEYILGVDVVRDRWVRYLYGVDWHSPFYYDLTIHVGQTGFDQAASALMSMAQLPDYQLNKYSIRAIKNLHLASKVHFLLAGDPRTQNAEFHVSANRGNVQITAQPRYADQLAHAAEVVQNVAGIHEITVCPASETILFVAEQYDPSADAFRAVMELARKRRAAVELVTLPIQVERWKGIYDENPQGVPPTIAEDDEPVAVGLRECHGLLRENECCGGCMAFYGLRRALVPALQRRNDVRLLVLGDLYMDRPPASRPRLREELKHQLIEGIPPIVVDQSELREQFRFGAGHAARMLAWLLAAAALLMVFFVFNDPMVEFFTGRMDSPVRIVSMIGVVVLAPLFAYAYGTFMKYVLRLMGLE